MSFLSVTRVIVIASTVLAVFGEAYLATTYAPQIFWIGAVGFVAMLLAGQRLRPIALPILMASLYLAPAILLVTINARGYEMDVVWILPLLGLVLSGRREVLQWSLPDRWQWPLITWATIVAIAWPIVFLREADFALWILPLERVSNTSIGIGPWLAGQMVAYFAIGHLVGILWLDALCRWYQREPDRLRPEVLRGLLGAAAIAAAVTIYQGFFDLGFLNEGFWEYMIRASGTLADPNKLGAVAAFWTMGAVVFGRRLARPWPSVIAVAGLVLGTATVWLSGSRTGLAGVAVSLTIAACPSLAIAALPIARTNCCGIDSVMDPWPSRWSRNIPSAAPASAPITRCRMTTGRRSAERFQRRTMRRRGGGTTWPSSARLDSYRSSFGAWCLADRCSRRASPAIDCRSACCVAC
jgi:hypothetical protein